MLRSIFQGIANAMRKLWGFIIPLFTWPFSLFGGSSRLRSTGLDIGAVKAVEQKLAETGLRPAELAASQMRDAQIAWSWIATSLLTRQAQPFPRTLSKAMQSWLQGLDHDQLVTLKNAGAAGILAHSTRENSLPNVPAMKPLSPVPIKFPPIAIQNSATEVAELRLSPT
jgi:hypothetical protein